jgi:hypothetical protein
MKVSTVKLKSGGSKWHDEMNKASINFHYKIDIVYLQLNFFKKNYVKNGHVC